jgi:hypothetical protein
MTATLPLSFDMFEPSNWIDNVANLRSRVRVLWAGAEKP